ncbi:cell wall surface anchor family protein [Rhodotorula toruloides]
MPAPPPSPSHFDRLPTELLKHIVVLVHQQDKVFGKGGVRRSSTRPDPEDVLYTGEARAPEPGAFSWWYGRGVHALSLLNKRLRELCLPVLLPTAKPAHFVSAFFIFGRVPQAILDGIQRIDLRTSNESDFVATAAALSKLKNVDTLELFVDDRLPLHPQYHYSEGVSDVGEPARALAKEAFGRTSSQISSLVLHEPGYRAFEDTIIPLFARTDSLRCLKFRDFGQALFNTARDVPAASLRKIARDYASLTHLDLSGADSIYFGHLTRNAPWTDAGQFSSLRTFQANATTFSVFTFIERAMPKLEVLKIEFTQSYSSLDQLDGTWTLPSLKRLQIIGPSKMTAVLAHLHLPALGLLKIALVRAENQEIDCSRLFTADTLLPQHVDMHFAVDTSLRVKNAEAVDAWCERHGIRLVHFSSNIFYPYSPAPPPQYDDEALEDVGDAIDAALRHAVLRKQRLLEFKDADGLQELAALVKPLREREFIEDM